MEMRNMPVNVNPSGCKPRTPKEQVVGEVLGETYKALSEALNLALSINDNLFSSPLNQADEAKEAGVPIDCAYRAMLKIWHEVYRLREVLAETRERL